MTITKTADVEGTLQQIYALAGAGCDIVRCTCNELEAAEGLAQIVPRSPVPIVADIHYQYKLALAALEAGVAPAAAQPGQHPQARAHQGRRRRGQGPGHLHPHRRERRQPRPRARGAVRRQLRPRRMVESAKKEMAYFEEVGFDLIKISVKSSNPKLMIEAYRQLADVTDHPLHLGVTEAGPPPPGPRQGHRRHRHAARGGHRRHHPLLADRRPGRGGQGRPAAPREPRPAGAPEARPHRLPVVRAGRDRRDRRGQRGPGRVRRAEDPDPGGGDGLRRERTGRGPRGRPRHRRRPQARPPVREGRKWSSCPRPRW